MIKPSRNVPKIRELIKDTVEVPRKILETMCLDVQQTFKCHLNLLLESELTFMLGRDRCGRGEGGVSYRNVQRKHNHKGPDNERRSYIEFHASFPEQSSAP